MRDHQLSASYTHNVLQYYSSVLPQESWKEPGLLCVATLHSSHPRDWRLRKVGGEDPRPGASVGLQTVYYMICTGFPRDARRGGRESHCQVSAVEHWADLLPTSHKTGAGLSVACHRPPCANRTPPGAPNARSSCSRQGSGRGRSFSEASCRLPDVALRCRGPRCPACFAARATGPGPGLPGARTP